MNNRDTPNRGYAFAVQRNSHVAGLWPVSTVTDLQRYASRREAQAHADKIDPRLQPRVVEVVD